MNSEELTARFKEVAFSIHGDAYNYDKVKVIASSIPVTITCPRHGDFDQRPSNHTGNKARCPHCANETRLEKSRSRLTTEKFIERAKAIHGDAYDYSKSVHEPVRGHKVTIICPEHGEFQQVTINHLQGKGCRQCSGKRSPLALRKAKSQKVEDRKVNAQFALDATKVHGERYGYRTAKITPDQSKVKILCKEHGHFWVKPSDHLSGQGCPKCEDAK